MLECEQSTVLFGSCVLIHLKLKSWTKDNFRLKNIRQQSSIVGDDEKTNTTAPIFHLTIF